jgi:hypothetical protein
MLSLALKQIRVPSNIDPGSIYLSAKTANVFHIVVAVQFFGCYMIGILFIPAINTGVMCPFSHGFFFLLFLAFDCVSFPGFERSPFQPVLFKKLIRDRDGVRREFRFLSRTPSAGLVVKKGIAGRGAVGRGYWFEKGSLHLCNRRFVFKFGPDLTPKVIFEPHKIEPVFVKLRYFDLTHGFFEVICFRFPRNRPGKGFGRSKLRMKIICWKFGHNQNRYSTNRRRFNSKPYYSFGMHSVPTVCKPLQNRPFVKTARIVSNDNFAASFDAASGLK